MCHFKALVLFSLLLLASLVTTAAGTVVVSGSWGSGAGRFAHAPDGDMAGPGCFALDALGCLYVVDAMNQCIKQFSPAGKLLNVYPCPTDLGDSSLAIALDLAPDGRTVRGRSIFCAYLSGSGDTDQLQIGKAERKELRMLKLPALPEKIMMISNIATDRQGRLFVETEPPMAKKDATTTTWLFDGNLHYRGRRDLSDICIQPGSECLVGVSDVKDVSGHPHELCWTVQFLSPRDMQYNAIRSVEIMVPHRKSLAGETGAHLIGVDAAGNLYVSDEILVQGADMSVSLGSICVYRYAPTGALSGKLNVKVDAKKGGYVLRTWQNIRVNARGEIFMVTDSQQRYAITRYTVPALAANSK